jgi:hypothetical protein
MMGFPIDGVAVVEQLLLVLVVCYLTSFRGRVAMTKQNTYWPVSSFVCAVRAFQDQYCWKTILLGRRVLL